MCLINYDDTKRMGPVELGTGFGAGSAAGAAGVARRAVMKAGSASVGSAASTLTRVRSPKSALFG